MSFGGVPQCGSRTRPATVNWGETAAEDSQLRGRVHGWMLVHKVFGERGITCIFDVRVFNSHAPSNCKSTQTAVYRRHENEKRRSYQQQVLEVEHGSFTLLVSSATGGVGPAVRVTYGRLASLLAEKRSALYRQVISWLRCLLNFSLLSSTVMCIWGARSTSHGPVVRGNPLNLAACTQVDAGLSC